MKSLIKKLLRESLLREDYVTSSQLGKLEIELDNLFKSVGVDIEFTKHFLDRVNDVRNGKEITIEELRDIFKKIYSQYKEQLIKYKDGFEAVFKNNPTNINIPFTISWDKENGELDLISKTIMRKKDFETSNQILYVTGKEQQPLQAQPNKDRFKKIKLTSGDIIRYYEQLNKFETLDGQSLDIDSIFDELPEDIQNKIMELAENFKVKTNLFNN
jgi:hypothetical protein